jgi:N-acetylmuramoyl-L-alanine amidase
MKHLLLATLLITATLVTATPTVDMTYEERVVALTILGEARGEGYEGMYAVACVIKQRSIERKLSPSKVCLQRKQFSCWNGKTVSDLDKLFQSPSARHAVSLAKNIDHVDVGSVGRANHYHNTSVNPYWADKSKMTKKIGNHIFYRL